MPFHYASGDCQPESGAATRMGGIIFYPVKLIEDFIDLIRWYTYTIIFYIHFYIFLKFRSPDLYVPAFMGKLQSIT